MRVQLCVSWLVPSPVLLGFLPGDPHPGQSRTELGHRCCGRSASLSLRECVPFLGQAGGGLGCPSSWAGWWGVVEAGGGLRRPAGGCQVVWVLVGRAGDARVPIPRSQNGFPRDQPWGGYGGAVKNSNVVPPTSATSSLLSGLGGVSTVDRKPRVDACSPHSPRYLLCSPLASTDSH